jgi:hypothetical protein
MSAFALRPVLLQLRLSIERFGYDNIGALLLCAIGILGWQWGVPYWRARNDMQHRELVAARQTLRTARTSVPPPVHSVDEERIAQFYGSLGENGYAEQQIKTLFAIAAKAGLALNQADYRPGTNAAGRYQTYQIVLPVRGPYRAIREFCEQTLLAIPFASLDQIDFRRDTIGSTTLETRLRFTLYLRTPQSRAEQTTTARPGDQS